MYRMRALAGAILLVTLLALPAGCGGGSNPGGDTPASSPTSATGPKMVFFTMDG